MQCQLTSVDWSLAKVRENVSHSPLVGDENLSMLSQHTADPFVCFFSVRDSVTLSLLFK